MKFTSSNSLRNVVHFYFYCYCYWNVKETQKLKRTAHFAFECFSLQNYSHQKWTRKMRWPNRLPGQRNVNSTERGNIILYFIAYTVCALILSVSAIICVDVRVDVSMWMCCANKMRHKRHEMKTRNAPKNAAVLFCIEKSRERESTKYAYMYQGYNKPSTDRTKLKNETKIQLGIFVRFDFLFWLQLKSLGIFSISIVEMKERERIFFNHRFAQWKRGHQNYVKVRQPLFFPLNVQFDVFFTGLSFHVFGVFVFIFLFAFCICLSACIWNVNWDLLWNHFQRSLHGVYR